MTAMSRAFVTGVEGTELSNAEKDFLRDAAPWGLILFRRNIDTPNQLRRLTADFRDAVGWDAPVLIDQEGGRVQRLAAPHWRVYPSAARLGAAARGEPDLVFATARLMAGDLRAVGITIDCAPCLDLRRIETTKAIGDRSFGADPDDVIRCGRAFAEGLIAGGVLPVIKHIPGHGRATIDSHLDLPRVDASLDDLENTDFAPFRALADLPAAMTAHVVYASADPDRPATLSSAVLDDVIRRRIGFSGLLLSDDLSMKALSGRLGDRAQRVLASGCDIALYCAGIASEMAEVAAAVPELAGKARARAERALAALGEPEPFDANAAVVRLEAALAAGCRSVDS
jgi:beta-N-acetylhexosaminidase